ncbi:hypothetical protein CHCC14821_1834 [Bacillus paralicheniformis]|nr:hypothetical protein CHCC14821_1834 [Bacillus paralicheniformis]TWM66416.1 hypothetical protein CHCC14814_3906 [Bacillus paralicheniformis]
MLKQLWRLFLVKSMFGLPASICRQPFCCISLYISCIF